MHCVHFCFGSKSKMCFSQFHVFLYLVPNIYLCQERKGYAVSCSGATYLTSSGQIHYHRMLKWITVSGIHQTYKNAFRCLF